MLYQVQWLFSVDKYERTITFSVLERIGSGCSLFQDTIQSPEGTDKNPQNTPCCQDFNWAPSKNKSEVLPLEPTCLVRTF